MAFNQRKKGILWANTYASLTPLNNSGMCAEDFYNTLVGTAVFNHGDATALLPAVDTDIQQRSIWSVPENGPPVFYPPGNDDQWAETVDILYFCGHGDPSGIHFSRRGSDDYSDEMARYEDIKLGDQKQIKWLIFDACQVLENKTQNGVNSVFNRWTQAFQPNGSLRYILGFHTTSKNDNVRGKYFAQKLNPVPGGTKGELIRIAWQYACEITDYAEWAILRVGDANSPIADDYWADTTTPLPDVPDVPVGGTQQFTYQKRIGPAPGTLEIIS